MPEIIDPPYTESDIPDFPQCSPTAISIIHVGCGAAGILFAHKIRRWLTNYQLKIYEKNPVPGGTWYENHYPGCACDVPAHSYTYTFEPNPNWSGFYSYASEIQEYFLKAHKKWNVDEFTQYNTEVTEARWLETEGFWEVSLRKGDGTTFTDKCNVLVNGSGVVNKWKWPAIEGLHDFQGILAHSAAWDNTIDWADKRVAVIGSGSSSIQMVPQFAKTAKHLTVFIRNHTYVGPMMVMNVSNKEADPEAADPSGAAFHRYTEKEKQKFREDPAYLLKYRRAIESAANGAFNVFMRGTPEHQWFRNTWQTQMAEALRGNEELNNFLIPEWSPGCRRLSPGDGYLDALIQKNTTVCTKEIIKVTSKGLVSADGIEHGVDIIACATGFYVQYLPHFKLIGVNGQVMQDRSEPFIYASIAAPGYPNYFVVNGPRGNWGQGCALPTHEAQIEYILQCCKKIQDDRIKSMVPNARFTSQLNSYMDAWHKKRSIWSENCRSWYKDNKVDGRVHIWAGSNMHHLKYMKHPRFEHYDIEYENPANAFAFLGNGFTITEIKYGREVPTPWVRNDEDEEWDIV